MSCCFTETKSSKAQSSKLANALMGQMPSAMSSLPKSSYAASKHSEATSGDSDGEEGDSISDFGMSASSPSESDTDDSDMDAMSSQDSEAASYTTQGSKRLGEESDGGKASYIHCIYNTSRNTKKKEITAMKNHSGGLWVEEVLLLPGNNRPQVSPADHKR